MVGKRNFQEEWRKSSSVKGGKESWQAPEETDKSFKLHSKDPEGQSQRQSHWSVYTAASVPGSAGVSSSRLPQGEARRLAAHFSTKAAAAGATAGSSSVNSDSFQLYQAGILLKTERLSRLKTTGTHVWVAQSCPKSVGSSLFPYQGCAAP